LAYSTKRNGPVPTGFTPNSWPSFWTAVGEAMNAAQSKRAYRNGANGALSVIFTA
jgi:hypothetical protein